MGKYSYRKPNGSMEIPAIDLSRVARNLKAIISYAKQKHKTTGATLTPT
jgi:hypothetical protein